MPTVKTSLEAFQKLVKEAKALGVTVKDMLDIFVLKEEEPEDEDEEEDEEDEEEDEDEEDEEEERRLVLNRPKST